MLAWRLTHISKTSAGYRYTSMDFHRVTGRCKLPDAKLADRQPTVDLAGVVLGGVGNSPQHCKAGAIHSGPIIDHP